MPQVAHKIHNHQRSGLQVLNNYDPTRTTTLRTQFAAEMGRRFRALRGIIRKAIIDQNCFGLTRQDELHLLPSVYGTMNLPGHNAFTFPRSSDKVEGFMEWLGQQQEIGILEMPGSQIGKGVEQAWTNKYIQSSYQKGIVRARQELRKAGYRSRAGDEIPALETGGQISAAFNQPFHADRCFIDKKIPIYTSKGWLPIGEICVGDRVLTHAGKFRKVTKGHIKTKRTPEVVTITLGNTRKQKLSLSATVGHPFLVNNEWKDINEIQLGDVISYLAARCKVCGVKIPYFQKFCSKSCQSIGSREVVSKSIKKKWENKEYREKTVATMKKSFDNGIRNRFEATKAANNATLRMIEDGIPIGFQRLTLSEKDELQRKAYEGKKDSIINKTFGFQNKELRNKAIKNGKVVVQQLVKEEKWTFQRPEVREKALQSLRKRISELSSQGEWGFQRQEIMEKLILASKTPESRQRKSEYMKKNCPMKRPEIAKKQSESLKKYYYDNPEKHPRYTMAQQGYMTSIERKVKEFLDEIKVEYTQEYPIKVKPLDGSRRRVYWVDFCLAELGIVIECDGTYWHVNQEEKDRIRQRRIEREGWDVVRFSEVDINNNFNKVSDEIQRIAMNHSGDYEFLELKVTKIKKWKIKNPRTLYNLSVDVDESYIAKGFVVHNSGLLYSRTFSGLKGITAAMDTQISRVLAQGIADGKHPRELAKLLTRTISGPMGDLRIRDTLGRFIPAERRAKILARTEIIRAHAQATLQEARNWGVEGVMVKAEWVTAGDGRVCPDCAANEGKVFTLDEASSLIPYHPQCRCAFIFVDMTGKEKEKAKPTIRIKPKETPPTPKPFVGDMEYHWLDSSDKVKGHFKDHYNISRVVGLRKGDTQALRRANMIGDAIGTQILDTLPALSKRMSEVPLKARLKNLTLTDKAGANFDTSDGALAFYRKSNKSITMLKSSMTRTADHLTFRAHNVGLDIKSIARHEYGHHVYYKVLTPTQRSAWDAAEALGEITHEGVSLYARKNSRELFAEAFAAYTSPLYNTSPRLPLKIEKMLEKLVGKRKDL